MFIIYKMSYCGGKQRTGKNIAEIIQKNSKFKNYIEPFCGMLGVTIHLNDLIIKCSDYNEDVIFILNELKNERLNIMPIINKELYNSLKNGNDLNTEGSFARLFCTYMSFYRGSFIPNDCVDNEGRIHKMHNRNFNRLQLLKNYIKSFEFTKKDYTEWEDEVKKGGYLIYCDPPYFNTAKIYKTKNFNSEDFWKTMKRWKDYGNDVFVSELVCPIEHDVLFEKVIDVSVSNKKKVMNDKLFKIL